MNLRPWSSEPRKLCKKPRVKWKLPNSICFTDYDEALKLDADWIGLLGAGTLAGLFVGTSLFGYISDKVGRRKMFLIDIIAIGVISVATMFVSSPVELLVMRVLIGIVIGADYPIATSNDHRVLQYPSAGVFHQLYCRDVVCRRDLRRFGRLLAL